MSEKNEKITMDHDEIRMLRSEVKDAINAANKLISISMLNPEERLDRFLEELTKISREYQLKIEKIDDGRVVLKRFYTIDDCASRYVLDSNGSLSFEIDTSLFPKVEYDIIDENGNVIPVRY